MAWTKHHIFVHPPETNPASIHWGWWAESWYYQGTKMWTKRWTNVEHRVFDSNLGKVRGELNKTASSPPSKKSSQPCECALGLERKIVILPRKIRGEQRWTKGWTKVNNRVFHSRLGKVKGEQKGWTKVNKRVNKCEQFDFVWLVGWTIYFQIVHLSLGWTKPLFYPTY